MVKALPVYQIINLFFLLSPVWVIDRFLWLISQDNRPYAIDVITQITKRETDGGRKFGYYAAILSGKNGRGLRSLSTVEHFASSRLTSAGNDFAFTPRMHKISTGPNTP